LKSNIESLEQRLSKADTKIEHYSHEIEIATAERETTVNAVNSALHEDLTNKLAGLEQEISNNNQIIILL
jgi:chromosome segregation ATPase